MTFHDLNEKLSEAQASYEATIKVVQEATSQVEDAKISLIKADSHLKGSRLELRLRDERIKSLREIAWNLRRESKI